MKFIIPLCFLLLVSCSTTKVEVVDGYIVNKTKVIRLTSKPDTVYYRTLWDGEVITEKEYDKRWDRALNNAMKKIKTQMKE